MTLQLLEISRFQFNLSMIIPEIHLIFDLFFDLILFHSTFHFHIGATPAACGTSLAEGRCVLRDVRIGIQLLRHVHEPLERREVLRNLGSTNVNPVESKTRNNAAICGRSISAVS